jgi:membrane fusion protein, multidrug efflux system
VASSRLKAQDARLNTSGLSASAIVVLALLASACNGESNDGEPEPAAAPPAVQIGPENVVTVKRDVVVVGPIISGEVRAQREATVRAELGGDVLQVMLEEGQPVRKGALLGRIEVRSLDDTRRSAESAVRSAEAQLASARREAERAEQLVKAGALAQRDVDVALTNVATVEAQLADARARLASVLTQLSDAVIRAPIGGVIARRAVNAGDVVSPGTELFTIIDPSSLRLEAAVPSDDLGSLRVGAPVRFEVRGYEEALEGVIERIAPQVDPTTRQVPIYVSIPNVGGRLVAGLFAEGRVIAESAEGLVVPSNAVNTGGDTPWVVRVIDGKAEKTTVQLGLVDRRTERTQIVGGVNEGDILLRGAAQGITPGTPVRTGD